jgi:CRISPR-associated endoribonuclease Cas6
MKLIIDFDMSKDNITSDYRYACLSYIKKLLSNNYPEKYDELYVEPTIKAMTFNLYLPNAVMGKQIVVPTKCCKLTISSFDKELIMDLYNASIKYRYKPVNFPDNLLLVPKYSKIEIPKTVKQNNIVLKTQSPILVRNHNKENNTDEYLTFEDQNFNIFLNININNLLKSQSFENDSVELIPIKANTTSVILKGRYCKASYGTFLLKTENIELVNFLYSSGIGSKRSLGFGMFEIGVMK